MILTSSLNTSKETTQESVNNDATSESGIVTEGYVIHNKSAPLKLFTFERRSPAADDVSIRIYYCGICHTDIHQWQNNWEHSNYPLVPGHEITGVVERVGINVTRFRIGDRVGVGFMVDSCLSCKNCQNNLEQHCPDACFTCNGTELDRVTPTYGGYSNFITVKEHFVCKIPKNLPLDAAAPLLCAGITVYSPLREYNVGKNTRLGVVGFGGLGHMAVKFGIAMGAQVTLISRSKSKYFDAVKLGVKAFIYSKSPEQLSLAEDSFDIILDTVSAPHDIIAMLNLLVFKGIYCMVGASPKSVEIAPFNLIAKRPIITGSLIGGMQETQEMLDFCDEHGITCDIEKIEATPKKIQNAYDRIMKSNIRFRFVLDIINSFK